MLTPMSPTNWSMPEINSSENNLFVLTTSLLPKPLLLYGTKGIEGIEFPRSLKFAPSGDFLSISHRLGVSLLDVSKGKLVTTVGGPSPTLSQDGKLAAMRVLTAFPEGTRETVEVWIVDTPHRQLTWFDSIGGILGFIGDTKAAYSENAEIVICRLGSSTDKSNDKSKEIVRLIGHEHGSQVKRLLYNETREIFASTSTDRTLRVWNNAGEQLHQFSIKYDIYDVGFSPNGQFLAVSSDDNVLNVWDLGKVPGDKITEFHLPPGQGLALELVFSPDNRTLATVSDNGVELWDVMLETKLHTLQSSERCTCITFSPDGRILAIGTIDGVYFWELNYRLLPQVLVSIRDLQQRNDQLQKLADNLNVGEEKSKDFADIVAAVREVELAKSDSFQFKKKAIQFAEQVEQIAFGSPEALRTRAEAETASQKAGILEEAARVIELIKIEALNLLLDKSNDPNTEAQKIEELRQKAEEEKRKALEASNQASLAAAAAEKFASQASRDYDNWASISAIFHLSELTETSAPTLPDPESESIDGIDSVDNWGAIKDIFGISANVLTRP